MLTLKVEVLNHKPSTTVTKTNLTIPTAKTLLDGHLVKCQIETFALFMFEIVAHSSTSKIIYYSNGSAINVRQKTD